MDRVELEAAAKEAMQSMGTSGVISYLIDWAERCFYMEMYKGLMDEMVTAQVERAGRQAREVR